MTHNPSVPLSTVLIMRPGAQSLDEMPDCSWMKTIGRDGRCTRVAEVVSIGFIVSFIYLIHLIH